MYVVVAMSAAPGPAGGAAEPAVGVSMRSLPVGVRHAVSRTAAAPTHALCGSRVSGWMVFPDQEFEAGHAASCQRCGQPVDETTRGPITRAARE